MLKTDEDLIKVSYSYNAWLRLKNVCVALKQTEQNVTALKKEITEKLQTTHRSREKKAAVQSSEILVNRLEARLKWHKTWSRTASAKLSRTRMHVKQEHDRVRTFGEEVARLKEVFAQTQVVYIAERENFIRTCAHLLLRRKQLVQELVTFAYPTVELAKKAGSTGKDQCSCDRVFQICSIHLPDAESYSSHNSNGIAAALGYVAHEVFVLSKLLDIPLRYPTYPFGSHSTVEDHIIDKLPDSDRVFPLFSRGTEKLRFQYAVFLLNKNIAQFRCHCGKPTHDLRCTLHNLKHFIDFFIGSKLEKQIGISKSIRVASPAPSIRSVASSACLSWLSDDAGGTASDSGLSMVAKIKDNARLRNSTQENGAATNGSVTSNSQYSSSWEPGSGTRILSMGLNDGGHTNQQDRGLLREHWKPAGAHNGTLGDESLHRNGCLVYAGRMDLDPGVEAVLDDESVSDLMLHHNMSELDIGVEVLED